MVEIWKDIDGYNGDYQISNFGEVKSFKRFNEGIYLKVQKDLYGYEYVGLSKGKVIMEKIHLLVWDYFGEEKRNGIKLQVDHIDNNKLNNRIDNLQLLTHRENTIKRSKQLKKTSKYTGVYWKKTHKKWSVEIWNKKPIFLGHYNDEEEAHLAYENYKNNL